MTRPGARWHLLAYDIRQPRRLQRLRRALRRQAAWLQHSLALLRLDEPAAEALLASLAPLLAAEDDLRLYRLDSLQAIWLCGPSPLPGVAFGSAPAAAPPSQGEHPHE